MKKKNLFFKSLVRGLNDAADGNANTTDKKITVVPIKCFSKDEIKAIRIRANMTQKMFAAYIGVFQKTVEAWENGKRTPTGSSSRILSMLEMNENLIQDYPFVITN